MDFQIVSFNLIFFFDQHECGTMIWYSVFRILYGSILNYLDFFFSGLVLVLFLFFSLFLFLYIFQVEGLTLETTFIVFLNFKMVPKQFFSMKLAWNQLEFSFWKYIEFGTKFQIVSKLILKFSYYFIWLHKSLWIIIFFSRLFHKCVFIEKEIHMNWSYFFKVNLRIN